MITSKPLLRSGFDCIIRPAPSGAGRTTPSQPGHYPQRNNICDIWIIKAKLIVWFGGNCEESALSEVVDLRYIYNVGLNYDVMFIHAMHQMINVYNLAWCIDVNYCFKAIELNCIITRYIIRCHYISMALHKAAVTPLLTHWSYCSLALSYLYDITCLEYNICFSPLVTNVYILVFVTRLLPKLLLPYYTKAQCFMELSWL